jgi:methionyl-tRNA formyltransferase
MQNNKNIKIIFFGTPDFSKNILEKLKENGFLPSLIVTSKDKPVGRKLVITPPPVKVFALENKINLLQPDTLKDERIYEEIKSYSKEGFDLGIVVSYGKIIPKNILDLPKYGILNIHPSLLPRLRDASPIESAILKENETGVSVMVLDEQMDHGPVLAQEKVQILWPPYASDLESLLAEKGGALLCRLIPDWINGNIKAIEQDHSGATFCSKIKKEDALLNLEDKPEENLRKIRAYYIWPKAYFFENTKTGKIRVIVKEAIIKDGSLLITKVIPEGRKEMSFEDFKNGFL